jgi:hypothetical protein
MCPPRGEVDPGPMAIDGKNILAYCCGLFSSRDEPVGTFHKNT